MKGKAAESFEDLHIYQRARELTNRVYVLTRNGTFSQDHGLIDQIRRAAVSIVSNIAEGFERGSSSEFIQYLYVAKGSCGEVRAQLRIACDQRYLDETQHEELHDAARRLSAMISNFIAHLQSSSYAGDRVSRPRRQSLESHQKRMQDLRAAQLRNMRKETNQPPDDTPA